MADELSPAASSLNTSTRRIAIGTRTLWRSSSRVCGVSSARLSSRRCAASGTAFGNLPPSEFRSDAAIPAVQTALGVGFVDGRIAVAHPHAVDDGVACDPVHVQIPGLDADWDRSA